jgi:hypothetical protein
MLAVRLKEGVPKVIYGKPDFAGKT